MVRTLTTEQGYIIQKCWTRCGATRAVL